MPNPANREMFRAARDLESGFHVLLDVGDLMAALMAQSAGVPAIGTTSVGLGLANGCPSSRAVSRAVMLDFVRTICRAVKVPVFVDLEQGYADTPDGVAETARLVLQAGAVGFNIEDSDGIPGVPLRDVQAHADCISAARQAADEMDLPALITGRTDTFWLNADMDVGTRTDEAIRRANRYLAAGADSIFISGRRGLSVETITRLVNEIDGPLNSLISAGGPELETFRDIGIHRLQTGSLATRAQSGFLLQAITDVITGQGTGLFDRYNLSTPELNKIVDTDWNSQP